MRGRMGLMKLLTMRRSLLLIMFAAQMFIISGCLAKYQEADKQVEAIDKRMKQIENDAANTSSPGRRRDVGGKLTDE
jgi:hypothetical protein